MRSSTERPTTENPTTEHPTTEHLNHVRPKPRLYMDGKIGLFSDVGGFGQKSKNFNFYMLRRGRILNFIEIQKNIHGVF